MPNAPKKHHFIPKFYLKRWTGTDGKLCEFCRRRQLVETRRCYPSATGYEENLYMIDHVPPEESQVVEQRFMSRVDQDASNALNVLLAGGQLDGKLINGWSRFLMSLLQRSPERVARIKEKARQAYADEMPKHEALYLELRKPSDPQTFEEYRAKTDAESTARLAGRMLQDFSDLPNLGRCLNNMIRSVVTIHRSCRELLTSDMPVIRSNGLGRRDAFLILPVSPGHLFVSTNDRDVHNSISHEMQTGGLLERINDQVVKQSHKYVYGVDDKQLRFVESHLSKETLS